MLVLTLLPMLLSQVFGVQNFWLLAQGQHNFSLVVFGVAVERLNGTFQLKELAHENTRLSLGDW